MKNIKFILALLIVGAVSYTLGYHNNDTKNYEAACLYADFVHSWMDNEDSLLYNPDSEIEESFYEWFQDLKYGVYNTKYLKSIDEMREYSWCY